MKVATKFNVNYKYFPVVALRQDVCQERPSTTLVSDVISSFIDIFVHKHTFREKRHLMLSGN